MAPLFSTGSHSRSLKRFCSIVLWPLASTTTLARTSARVPASVCDAHADGPVAFEEHLQHAAGLNDLDALLAGVVEHHRVELAADHLPGLRAFVRLVVVEVERRRLLPGRVDELHAVFLDEGAGLHLVEHVQTLEHPIGFGNQRLADVEAREFLALVEANLAPRWARIVETVLPAGPPPTTTTSVSFVSMCFSRLR